MQRDVYRSGTIFFRHLHAFTLNSLVVMDLTTNINEKLSFLSEIYQKHSAALFLLCILCKYEETDCSFRSYISEAVQ